MVFLRAILIASVFVVSMVAAFAGEHHEKPSAWFCWVVKAKVAAAGGEVAAEQAARAGGASEADIAKAKRCKGPR